MIDLDMITNPKKFLASKGAIKRGYQLSDKEEFELVRKTIVKYNLSPKNFDTNLSTLIIDEKYDDKGSLARNEYISGSYHATSNSINYPKILEDRIHELFHMASNDTSINNSATGIEQEGKTGKFGTSLNEGITDFFTRLTRPNYKCKYPVEEAFASFLSDMYGIKIYDNYFECNPQGFYEGFGPNQFLIRDFVTLLDEYHKKSLFFYENFRVDSKQSMRLSSELTDLFIKCCVKFADIVAMNQGDMKKYLGDLRTKLSDHDNSISEFINLAFIYSGFGDLNNVFKSVSEEISKKEGFGL